jgi:phosphodiesterase/alkaline phosphatase D-like protein
MTDVKRRRFLKSAGLAGTAVAASTLAAPAIAQSSPEIR